MASICVGPEFCVDPDGNLRLQTRDTGLVALSGSSMIQFASGWSAGVNGSYARRAGDTVWLRIAAHRTGATISPAAATHDIADQVVATIVQAAFRPQITWYGSWVSGVTHGGGLVSGSGSAQILTSTAAIAPGDDIIICMSYPGSTGFQWPVAGCCGTTTCAVPVGAVVLTSDEEPPPLPVEIPV